MHVPRPASFEVRERKTSTCSWVYFGILSIQRVNRSDGAGRSIARWMQRLFGTPISRERGRIIDSSEKAEHFARDLCTDSDRFPGVRPIKEGVPRERGPGERSACSLP